MKDPLDPPTWMKAAVILVLVLAVAVAVWIEWLKVAALLKYLAS